jgi:predicted Fe-Mo cluster-binding NifX family protein
LCGGLGAGAVTLLDDLGITVHAGAPAIEVEDVLRMFLDGSIVYGDGSCHHDGCAGHHH